MDQIQHIQTTAIKNAVNGDENAQAWLYRQYSKAMFNICTRMTSSQSNAEDVLQDAFIIAFKNIAQLKDAENFGGWLRRIVVNECIKYSKRSFMWREWSEDELHNTADENTEWWSSVSIEMLHKEIKELPEGCRQVFVLYALEDYTHKDIANNLGVSESTSKSQYHRARFLLRQRITTQIAIHG